ncbi:hypothetical protein CRV24_010573 [Beauveria bassiana]|nr:hypothetical protein CRV24_010573 [Beauveria bassiana]
MSGNNKPISLRLFQANVDKCESAHYAALQLAHEKDYNVVLLQEPHSSYNEKKDTCRVPDHPGFTCFSQSHTGTLGRHAHGIQPEQLTVVLSATAVGVVNGTTILNVYNDPK